jgi:hypothetical protein
MEGAEDTEEERSSLPRSKLSVFYGKNRTLKSAGCGTRRGCPRRSAGATNSPSGMR